MTVLTATAEQYNALNGYRNGNSVLQFVKDAADNWIVGKQVLTDDAFAEIRPQLQQLEEIPFNPVTQEL